MVPVLRVISGLEEEGILKFLLYFILMEAEVRYLPVRILQEKERRWIA